MVPFLGFGMLPWASIVGFFTAYQPSIIEWKSISSDNDFSKECCDGNTFGGKYKDYLASPLVVNKKWWNMSYSYLLSDVDEGEKSIIEGKTINKYFGDDEDSLNKACENIYKYDFQKIVGNYEDNKFNEIAIWRYCSPFGLKPEN